MLSVTIMYIMLSVIMLNLIMLNVMAPDSIIGIIVYTQRENGRDKIPA
jgi:hypothetical protein